MSLLTFNFFGEIILIHFLHGCMNKVHILNTYAPYYYSGNFWKHMDNCGIFKLGHLLIVGDLNSTLDRPECWVVHCRMDPLANFISDMVWEAQMKDFLLEVGFPTWYNGRRGDDYITKRLDHFLL